MLKTREVMRLSWNSTRNKMAAEHWVLTWKFDQLFAAFVTNWPLASYNSTQDDVPVVVKVREQKYETELTHPLQRQHLLYLNEDGMVSFVRRWFGIGAFANPGISFPWILLEEIYGNHIGLLKTYTPMVWGLRGFHFYPMGDVWYS